MKRFGVFILILILFANIPIQIGQAQDSKTWDEKDGIETTLNRETGEITFSKHEGEYWISLKTPETPDTAGSLSDKETLTYPEYKIDIYELGVGMEYEIIFSKPPITNKIRLDIECSKGVRLYYQPPYTEEYPIIPKGYFRNETHVISDKGIVEAYRPENVIYSYAVYGSKRNNEYETGKIGHIYRPLIYDSNGWEIWLNMSLIDNQLIIEIPQNFIDNAHYPITVDPYFGYKTAGGSWLSVWNSIRGTDYEITEDGTADNITAYIANVDAGDTFRYGIYLSSDLSFINDTAPVTGGSIFWRTLSVTDPSPSLSANTNYTLVVWAEDYVVVAYDTLSGTYGHLDSETWGAWPDPLVDGSPSTNHFSIFVNYTVAAGGVTYLRELTQSLNYTIDFDKSWNLTRAFDQDLDFSFNVDRGWTLTRVMELTLNMAWDVYATLSAGVDYLRQLTIQLTTGWTVEYSTVPTFKRVVTQAYNFIINVERTLGAYTGWTWLNVLVENVGGSPISSAVVSLWNMTSGLLFSTETTNATGFIPSQNISIGNYTIQVIASTYENYMDKFTAAPNTLLTVILNLTEDTMGFNIELLVFSALASGFMLLGWFDEWEKGLIASYISFFIWFATGLWWLWDKAPAGTMDFFYIFEMLALVALMMGIYKTMTLGTKTGKKGVTY